MVGRNRLRDCDGGGYLIEFEQRLVLKLSIYDVGYGETGDPQACRQ